MMNPIITNLDASKSQWMTAQPLKVEDDERLWKKFRLEWSYNSNHIEGNTLTYGETELLIILGQTKGNHTIREYDEMKAHDLAVRHILKLAERVACNWVKNSQLCVSTMSCRLEWFRTWLRGRMQ